MFSHNQEVYTKREIYENAAHLKNKPCFFTFCATVILLDIKR